MSKTSKEDKKAVDVGRIRSKNKAKRENKRRDIANKKAREDDRQADKKERYKEEKEKERQRVTICGSNIEGAKNKNHSNCCQSQKIR